MMIQRLRDELQIGAPVGDQHDIRAQASRMRLHQHNCAGQAARQPSITEAYEQNGQFSPLMQSKA